MLTSLLFAGSFVAGKYTTVELGPLMTTLLRYLIAAAFLQGLLWQRSRLGFKQGRFAIGSWQEGGLLFLLGTFGVVGYHFFFFLSLRHTVVANTAIINAFNPVVTGFLAAVFLRERLSGRNYLGGAIAILGVLILLTDGQLARLLQLQFSLGDLLMLCAVGCWAIYSILLRHLGMTYSGLALSYYAALFGILQLLVLTLPELWRSGLPQPSLAASLGILYMGIGASGLGYLLFVLSTQRIGPTKSTSIVYSGVPFWVALLAWLFFREPITPWMVVSVALILLGLWTVLQPRQS
ncbi:DMT family transporter [Romeria aff. gracilis LEGE 07310]|uniref:DMT family transporter n=1 Tax=Vasconcelosia minhoensis LEGE 07310 TaxID=915328 RepID=A0A8J7AVZ9_9CYAN|nr:DMT family transporter [Romeria gracilis]MBE9076737.1 DMT family transporter [Romeria aff. gracilis LEGE 07310]